MEAWPAEVTAARLFVFAAEFWYKVSSVERERKKEGEYKQEVLPTLPTSCSEKQTFSMTSVTGS